MIFSIYKKIDKMHSNGYTIFKNGHNDYFIRFQYLYEIGNAYAQKEFLKPFPIL